MRGIVLGCIAESRIDELRRAFAARW